MDFFTFGLKDDSGIEAPSEILGGKGAGLVWMSAQGVPVPPGFIIPTTVWAEYDKKPKTAMKEIIKTLPEYFKKLEDHFGYMPLLSVRSGARVSCPGMMDTILNVGLDAQTEDFWRKKLGQTCYDDSLHRLLVMYGSVVEGIHRSALESDLKTAFDELERQSGHLLPSAQKQVYGAIEAVFKSWDNDRAKVYRKLNNIPREWGTAVTIQAMVFGNLNDQSGTGVLFTRNPDTGQMKVTGEFLPNAQGEDIVAGIRTPISLDDMKAWNPGINAELMTTVLMLEKLKKDVQDVEFTIQDGKLYILQTRNAKRSAPAALRIALDMHQEGFLTAKEAVRRVTIRQFDQAQMAHLDPKFKKMESFKGIAACSGLVSGVPVFTKEDAIDCKKPCILITQETTPDDIAGMYAAKGVITMVGGLTCHAAVVARSMSKACIVGVGQSIEVFKEAEIVSMDGATGKIWMEEIPIVQGESNGLVKEFSGMVFSALGVVPIISDAPGVPLSQALLYLGDTLLDTAKAVKLVTETSKQVGQLYLDVTPESGSPEEHYFSLVASANLEQKFYDALPVAPEKITIIGGSGQHPFKTVGAGSDLRALVLADQEIMVDGLAMAVDDPAIQKVMAWKKAEGVTMVSVGKYRPTYKSMLSVQQALQVLSKEGV